MSGEERTASDEFKRELVKARRNLREALALVDGIDRSGDDENDELANL